MLIDPGARHGSGTHDFPYDVTFLSWETLQQIAQTSRDFHTEFWPIERIRAYQGKDICAKRAAVTGFLWQRYVEYPTMTLEILHKWVEIEALEQLLTVPAWFRNQHVGENVMTIWQEKLGTKYQEVVSRHQEVLGEIRGMMKT